MCNRPLFANAVRFLALSYIVLYLQLNNPGIMGEEVGKIFVGGVERSTQPDTFRQYFEKYGKLSDFILMMDKERGVNKGFGFVTFADPSCVEAVVSTKNHRLDGKELDCKRCKARGTETRQGPGDQQRKKKIFVGGISQQATKDDLFEVFSNFGTVEDVHIMIDNETLKHRGFGFVTFESEEDVEKLVQMQHVELKGKSMEIKKAQPRNNPGQGRNFGGQGGGFQQRGGGGGNWNQGGGPGYGGSNNYGGGNNQWNMGQPMGQFGGPQGGGYQQQRGGGGGGFGGPQQQQGFNNGYRQPQQQQGGYGQQQPQQAYGGKHSGGGDNYADQRSRNGAPNYGNYGGYQQPQQDPYGQQQQQQQPQQQYQTQGSMGNYAQEASTYGPQRGNYNQQGYNQGPQTQQQPPQQNYGQVEGGQDMYGSNNYGKGNMGNQFHPYSR
ncbi:heterogeneous nuclear ribonucleoprotein A0-like isoform X2 [Lytechinus variegatus]|uniref:heterogeneous nuclear ribonucleoprotein A0-like isoform X2 n=1 Tax=Lytechinus variegatus TaxID=7654 RepID=UPI001BB0EA38|nr:heterogeneous nuclear ribonucleoprotein A0-like isoform X2 [Lytechinus variegatus]